MLHKNSISLQAAKKAREQEEKQEGRPKKNVYRIFKREMVGIISDQCFKLCEVPYTCIQSIRFKVQPQFINILDVRIYNHDGLLFEN